MDGQVTRVGGYWTAVYRYRRPSFARRHRVGWWVVGVGLGFVLGLVVK